MDICRGNEEISDLIASIVVGIEKYDNHPNVTNLEPSGTKMVIVNMLKEIDDFVWGLTLV